MQDGPREQPIGGGAEVAIGLATALIGAARDEGVDVGRVLRGVGLRPDELEGRIEGIGWTAFARLCENVGELWGDHGLELLGARFFETTIGRQLAAVGGSFEEPSDFYRWLGESPRHRAITCIEQELVVHDATHVSVSMRMQVGYAPCRAFFQLRKGFLAVVPCTFGRPAASIEMHPIRAGARFDIEIVEAPRLRRLIQRLGRFVRTGDAGAAEAPEGRALAGMIENVQALHEEAQRRLVELEERNARLARSERRFNEVFRGAPLPMLITDYREGWIVDVNARFSELTGIPPDEAIGRRGTELGLWPDLGERDANRALRRERAGRLEGVELRIRTRWGYERTMMVSTRSLTLDGTDHLLWQAVDITERKETEEQLAGLRRHFEDLATDRAAALERSQEMLRQSERLASIGTLAAGIAHQINNPIGSIRTAAEFALMIARDPAEQAGARGVLEEALQMAVDQSRRAGEIVHGILQFARGQETARVTGDCVALIRQAIEQVSRYAEERNATLHLAGDLEAAWVSMSAIELEQVFVNLLRNAVESGEEGKKVRVGVKLVRRGELLRVQIEDDGRGISADELPHIFDPFHTTRLSEGGTGLGLSIAHGIVMAHEGRIQAESAPGRGLRMTLELPLVAPPGA